MAQAIVAEIEADQLLRSVVAVADANAASASFCLTLKQGLANAANKIAARAAAMSTPAEIKDMVEGELNRCFTTARAELEQAWSRIVSTPAATHSDQ